MLTCRRSRLSTFTLVPQVGNEIASVGQTSFDNIPNYAEFQALYRQYSILEWSFNFRLVDQDQASGTFPTLYIWKQMSTGLSGSSISQTSVQELSGVKVFSFSAERKNFRFTVRPYMVTTVFAGATPGYLVIPSTKRTWLDINYTDVSQYGIAFLLTDFFNTTNQIMMVDQEWKVALRGMQ